uniref:uS14m n=1 Tax=Polytomella magna TaxID=353565 RepID=UPI002240E364|nr:Chain Bn, uS14m [Polytomella magna]8APN_Bn Chain Bn, uS14m [Polytomella magna]8APO_Bn Chain Bn, uS14m [Polytomella magna]
TTKNFRLRFRIPQYPDIVGSRRIDKDQTRRVLYDQHEVDRRLYKAMTRDESLTLPVRLQVQRLFETEMPRDSAPSRIVDRCVLTGRVRGLVKFAGLSRIMLRQLIHYGHIGGVAKASW